LDKKSSTEKHLSPSRRRALRPFFVQSGGVVQSSPQPAPTGRLVGELAFSLIAKIFSGMQNICTIKLRASQMLQARRPRPVGTKNRKCRKSEIFVFGCDQKCVGKSYLVRLPKNWQSPYTPWLTEEYLFKDSLH
jgi:hypothetical protein